MINKTEAIKTTSNFGVNNFHATWRNVEDSLSQIDFLFLFLKGQDNQTNPASIRML